MTDTAAAVVARAETGAWTLFLRSEAGAMAAMHSEGDPEGEARGAAEGFHFAGEGLIVVCGMGLGYHVAELARRFPRARIAVVEGRAELPALAERYGVLPQATQAGPVRCLAGLDREEVVRQVAAMRLLAGFGTTAVFEWGPAVRAFPSYYSPLLESLHRSVTALRPDRFRYRRFATERLCVAMFDLGYFLTAEISRALESLGHRVVRIEAQKTERCGPVLARVVRAVAEARPDFVLTVNHLGFDTDGILAAFLASIELPAACWYVDSPNLVVRDFRGNVTPWVKVFVWDRSYLPDLRAAGFEEPEHLPLATDETVFRPLRVPPRLARRLAAAAGFVGNSMVGPCRDRIALVPPALRDAAETAARAMASPGVSFRDSLARAGGGIRAAYDRLDGEVRAAFEGAVLWKATLHYRLRCVSALAAVRPVIHGDPGWKELLDGSFRLRPPLHYYRELPAFYNVCAVNFNATSRQMAKAVNQRVFDVPACGAFLLTDDQGEMGELFEPGREAVVYRSPEEIPDLAAYYLRNEAARAEVAARARGRVLAEHTYRHRMARIVEAMRKRYA